MARVSIYEPYGYEEELDYQSRKSKLDNELKKNKENDEKEFSGLTELFDKSFAQVVYDSGNTQFLFKNFSGETKGVADMADIIPSDLIADTKYDADTKELVITFKNGQTVAIPIDDLIDVNEFGDGLEVVSGVAKVKIDENGETFLTVSEDGVKLDGVQDAINGASAAVDEKIEVEVSRAQEAERVLQANIDQEAERAVAKEAELEEKVDTVSGTIESIVDSVSAMQESVDAMEEKVDEFGEALSGKADTTAVTEALDAKADTTAVTQEIAEAVSGKASQEDLEIVSGKVDTLEESVETKADQSDLDVVSGKADTNAEAIVTLEETVAAKADTSAVTEAIEAAVSGKASQEDLETVDGKVDALETELSNKADVSAVTSTISGLSYDDEAIDFNFVSEIDEVDGVISVTRKALSAVDDTVILVNDNGNVGFSVNIDGETIVKDANGVLGVASNALTQYVGDGKTIAVSEVDLNNQKEISATISMLKIVSGLPANVQEAYQLVDADGTKIGDQINIYKDSSLLAVALSTSPASWDAEHGVIVGGGGEAVLAFAYQLADSYQVVVTEIPISQLVTEAHYKDGLQVNENNEVSVKIDSTSEEFLTVSEDGVKLSGVSDAISSAVNTHASDSDIHTTAAEKAEWNAKISGVSVNGKSVTVTNNNASFTITASNTPVSGTPNVVVIDTDNDGNITIGLGILDAGTY